MLLNSVLFFSPLEQFKVKIVKPILFLGLDFSITNTTVYLFVVWGLFFIFLNMSNLTVYVLPHGMQRIGELMFLFVNGLVKQQAGVRVLVYFPVLFVLFYFIFFLNLVGLTPFGFTCTSQIVCTLTLSFTMFISIVTLGITIQRNHFIEQFIPSVKGAIVPLLVVIEVFSYLIRPFSLAIRLFANMLAGHTLLHIIAGFGVGMANIDILLVGVLCIPLIAVCILELGIAFLQAYVFVVLTSIYLKESFYGH
jgi:F-type H+-transporting ATPase subunit a